MGTRQYKLWTPSSAILHCWSQ